MIMVDETELDIMDADERRDTPVVIRFIQGHWCIAHAKSYQSAFGSSVNRFDRREDAIEFAEDHDCEVFVHYTDQLQAHASL